MRHNLQYFKLFPLLIVLGLMYIYVKDSMWNPNSDKPSNALILRARNGHDSNADVSEIQSPRKQDGKDDFVFSAKNIFEEIDWEKVDDEKCIDKGDLSETSAWKKRLSYGMIIGAMKSGTTALNMYIRQHSMVANAKSKEQHFFDITYHKLGLLENPEGTRDLYFAFMRNQFMGQVTESNNMISIEDSPRYLFWSDRIPQRILCSIPWVKLMIVLRNPIDRAYSQFNMKLRSPRAREVNFTFEDWIEDDIRDLTSLGIIQSQIPFNEFKNSEMELNAWKIYTRNLKHSPIGRGLYAIQLRQWFKALNDAGKSLNDVLIIQSEIMKEAPSLVYKDVLEFLDLPIEPLNEDEGKTNTGHYEPMKEETRERLEQLYAPFNEDLYELLGKDWNGAWEV